MGNVTIILYFVSYVNNLKLVFHMVKLNLHKWLTCVPHHATKHYCSDLSACVDKTELIRGFDLSRHPITNAFFMPGFAKLIHS